MRLSSRIVLCGVFCPICHASPLNGRGFIRILGIVSKRHDYFGAYQKRCSRSQYSSTYADRKACSDAYVIFFDGPSLDKHTEIECGGLLCSGLQSTYSSCFIGNYPRVEVSQIGTYRATG